MGQEIEYLDLREVPNEFIVAAYNMITPSFRIDRDVFNLEKSDVGYRSLREDFKLVLNPNCYDLLVAERQKLLNDFKQKVINICNDIKPENIIGKEFQAKFEELKERETINLRHISNLGKAHRRFYHVLKGLCHEKLGDFNNYRIIDIEAPKDSDYEITIYPNLVLGMVKPQGIKHMCYTKNEEAALNNIIQEIYDATENTCTTEPQENE